jgi:hypothetical protein
MMLPSAAWSARGPASRRTGVSPKKITVSLDNGQGVSVVQSDEHAERTVNALVEGRYVSFDRKGGRTYVNGKSVAKIELDQVG